MKIGFNYSDMTFILHKTRFTFMTPKGFKLKLAEQHYETSDQLQAAIHEIEKKFSFTQILMIIESIAENSGSDELRRNEEELDEEISSPMLCPIQDLLTLLSSEHPDYRDITIIDIIAGMFWSKRNKVDYLPNTRLVLGAQEELKRLEELCVAKIQVNPDLESELRTLKSSLLELNCENDGIQSERDNIRSKNRYNGRAIENLSDDEGDSSGDSSSDENSISARLERNKSKRKNTKEQISKIQHILRAQSQEKVAKNPDWENEMNELLSKINKLKFAIDNFRQLYNAISKIIPTSLPSSITNAGSGELQEAEKKLCWYLACALVIQYRSVYGLGDQYTPLQRQKMQKITSCLDPNSDHYPNAYACSDRAVIIWSGIVITSIIAIAAPVCLLTGHYLVSSGLLLMPALFLAYWAVRQISSEFRVLMQDFLTRPRVACAFILLSLLLLAATGVGLFFMWQAVLPAYHLTGYIAFGVLTTLMASVPILLTFPVKMLVNNFDGHLAQKSDSYASTHSGFIIDEDKLQATCETRKWNIDVTREALRTLAAKYEKITIENFPMNPKATARETMKIFMLILNGDYQDDQRKSLIAISIDSKNHQFDLSDTHEYSSAKSHRFFSDSAASAPKPVSVSNSVSAGAGAGGVRGL